MEGSSRSSVAFGSAMRSQRFAQGGGEFNLELDGHGTEYRTRPLVAQSRLLQNFDRVGCELRIDANDGGDFFYALSDQQTIEWVLVMKR